MLRRLFRCHRLILTDRFCWFAAESGAESAPLPEKNPTFEQLKALKEKVETEGKPREIGSYLSCEGEGTREIARTTVEIRHLPLLLSYKDKGVILRSVAGTAGQSLEVRQGSDLLGVIPLPDGLWKGDLLRTLQLNARGLLVDSLRGVDYDRAMTLEKVEMDTQFLSRLERYEELPPAEQDALRQSLQEIFGITEAMSLTILPLPSGKDGLPLHNVLLASKKAPGRLFVDFDAGKRYVRGPEANVARVRSMNILPPFEEMPRETMVTYLSALVGLTEPLVAPDITVKHNAGRTTLMLTSQATAGGRSLAAEVELDDRTGALLRKTTLPPPAGR